MDIDQPVHIGSLGKAMTAVVAGMLVQDGVIAWTSTPPEVLDWANSNDSWREATLERLLRMNGGVDRSPEIEQVFNRWLKRPREVRTDDASAPTWQRSGRSASWMLLSGGWFLAEHERREVAD